MIEEWFTLREPMRPPRESGRGSPTISPEHLERLRERTELIARHSNKTLT